jgi:hypothetical protein
MTMDPLLDFNLTIRPKNLFILPEHFDHRRILYEECESFAEDLTHVYPDLD